MLTREDIMWTTFGVLVVLVGLLFGVWLENRRT